MTGALAGVRVLDLADESAALCGRLLADLGADVVLAEPAAGSALRCIPPFFDAAPDPARSLFFWFYARGKRSVVADDDLLARLAAAADVVIDTGPPGAGRARAARHPRLVVAAVTPFGQEGPYRDWRASDLVAQAMGGMLAASGHADGPPLRALGLQAYHQAALFAAIGSVAALLARDRTGRGQLVDVSLQAAVAGALEHVPGQFHQSGAVARRQGTLHWTRCFRVGRSADGPVLHCTLGDWTALVEWLRADGMAADLVDDAWTVDPYRREHAEHLFDVLDAWAARYTTAELCEGAQLRRLPYAAVRPPEALLDDPQLAARGWFVPIEHPDLDRIIPYPGPPVRLAGWSPGRRPPLPGEHTAEVVREWIG